MEAHFRTYLDTRHKKDNGLYPVKLRVLNKITKKVKLYSLGLELSKETYKDAEKQKANSDLGKEYQQKLIEFRNRARKILEDQNLLTFEAFEKKYFRSKADNSNILRYYQDAISKLKTNSQLSSALTYELSLRSLLLYQTAKTKKPCTNISFYEINDTWLNGFEKYMIGKSKSPATIGIYLRPLRAIFNAAILEKNIKQDIYPFSKKSFIIPTAKKVKKSLNQEQIKFLFYSAIPMNEEQQKAKDFWFFSYSANGMNFKDICLLKYKVLELDKFTFVREKTKSTTKENISIEVYLNDYIQGIFKKYSTQNKKPNNYVFDIVKPGMSSADIKRTVSNFIRFVNQHMESLCKIYELPKVTTYTARHTFATLSVIKGKSLEFMRETLGHTDMKTTQTYFDGFPDDTKKEFAQTLMDF